MRIIKVIYDDGSDTIVKVKRLAHKNNKRLSDMTSEEIAKFCCGLTH